MGWAHYLEWPNWYCMPPFTSQQNSKWLQNRAKLSWVWQTIILYLCLQMILKSFTMVLMFDFDGLKVTDQNDLCTLRPIFYPKKYKKSGKKRMLLVNHKWSKWPFGGQLITSSGCNRICNPSFLFVWLSVSFGARIQSLAMIYLRFHIPV